MDLLEPCKKGSAQTTAEQWPEHISAVRDKSFRNFGNLHRPTPGAGRIYRAVGSPLTIVYGITRQQTPAQPSCGSQPVRQPQRAMVTPPPPCRGPVSAANTNAAAVPPSENSRCAGTNNVAR